MKRHLHRLAAALMLLGLSACGSTHIQSVHNGSLPDNLQKIYVIIDHKDIPEGDTKDIAEGLRERLELAFAAKGMTAKFQMARPTGGLELERRDRIDVADVVSFAPDAVLMVEAAAAYWDETDIIFTSIKKLTSVNYMAELGTIVVADSTASEDGPSMKTLWRAEIRNTDQGSGKGLGRHVGDAIIAKLSEDGVLALK